MGKLTLALFAWVGGYRANDFDFVIGNVYPNKDYIFARAPSAFFGTCCIPLMYLICRELRLSVSSSCLGAALPLFDNLLIIESRLILIDAQLIFYLNFTLFCALRLWNIVESGRQGTAHYFIFLIGTAVSGAAAFSVKWTAAATLFLVAVVCGFGVWFTTRPMPIAHRSLAAVVGLAFYVVPWFIHIRMSTISTPEAVRMGNRFRETLTGNRTFPYKPGNNVTFVESLYELHLRQFRANQKVKTRHVWESRWYEWPLNLRGIYYFVDKAESYTEEHPVVRMVYLLQNPAGALWVFAGVMSFMLVFLFIHRYRHDIPKHHRVHDLYNRGSFLFTGYLLNLLPYVFIERCYFLYHYMPALTFGQLLTVYLIDAVPNPLRFLLAGGIVTSVSASFVFWAPWIYCLPIDFEGIARRQCMPRWN